MPSSTLLHPKALATSKWRGVPACCKRCSADSRSAPASFSAAAVSKVCSSCLSPSRPRDRELSRDLPLSGCSVGHRVPHPSKRRFAAERRRRLPSRPRAPSAIDPRVRRAEHLALGAPSSARAALCLDICVSTARDAERRSDVSSLGRLASSSAIHALLLACYVRLGLALML